MFARQTQHRSVLALLTFTIALVVVEEVLVVVFVITVDGHSDQTNERADVDRCVFFAGRVFGATDGASAKDRACKTAQQQTANIHVRPFESQDLVVIAAGRLSRAAKVRRFSNSAAMRLSLFIHRRFLAANSFQVAPKPILPLGIRLRVDG